MMWSCGWNSNKPSPSHHHFFLVVCLPFPVMGSKNGIVLTTSIHIHLFIPNNHHSITIQSPWNHHEITMKWVDSPRCPASSTSTAVSAPHRGVQRGGFSRCGRCRCSRPWSSCRRTPRCGCRRGGTRTPSPSCCGGWRHGGVETRKPMKMDGLGVFDIW